MGGGGGGSKCKGPGAVVSQQVGVADGGVQGESGRGERNRDFH